MARNKKNKSRKNTKVENVILTEDVSLEDYDSLKSCEDEDLLAKTLEKKKTEIYTEDIYIKVLEANILKLNKEILDIQEKEKAHIKSYIDEHEKRKSELEEEYKKAHEQLVKEKEDLVAEYEDKKKYLDDLYIRKGDSQKEEYQKTLKDLGNMRTSLEKEFNEKNSTLEEEYNVKNTTLDEEFKTKNASLEEEFTLKNQTLDKTYNDRITELEDSFAKKFKDLDEEYTFKSEELLAEYEAKRDFLEDYKEELETKNKEKYEELMNKIISSKNEFEAFMKKQKELFEEEIRLKNLERDADLERINNDLKEKEAQINKDYNDKLDSLKQSEIEFLQKENELNDKISDLNKKVETFNNNKSKFVKRHYLVHRLYKNFLKHKVGFCIFGVSLFLILFYFGLVFEYQLFKKDFISESISNSLDSKSYDDTISIYLDTSKSAFAKFTELDGLNIDLNYKYNGEMFQTLNTYTLSYGKNHYKWERYYKNDTMIAKSAFHGQYIIIENFKNHGFKFDRDEEHEIFVNSFRKFLARTSNFDFDECYRLNIENNNSFFSYLKQGLFLSSNYEYYYNLKSDTHKANNQLFNDIFKIFLDCDNYESFEKEEASFQSSLGMTDALANSKEILKNIVRYSTVENTEVNTKITQGNEIKIVDIYFNLAYQDDTMVNSVPMGIRVTCEFDSLDEGSLDDAEFTENAVFYEGLGNK